ncbi:MAG: hypothetical protein WD601_09210, partial [Pseudohongiellaceae bacterium]
LRLRGPGEILGSRQSGSLSFRIADLVRDHAMLPEIRRISEQLLAQDRSSAEGIMQRWLARADTLSQV